MKRVLKSKREWLEKQSESGSSYALDVSTDDYNKGVVQLSFSDCHRTINWWFGKPGEARAKRKIAKLKKLIDSIYNHLHKIEEARHDER